MASFKHEKLRSNEIRLLRPQRTRCSQYLHFDIITISRDAAPSYTAVSYTWGDSLAEESIYIKGARFPVRTNLWSCLHYLSLDAVHSDWSYIWVDAICIDQGNQIERSEQVRMMDGIYRDASCVSVWLGLAPLAEPYAEAVVSSPRSFKTIDVEPLDWMAWMSELANRPYWSRFWVIQECLLGRQVEIVCSGQRIEWSRFKDHLSCAARIDLYGEVHERELFAVSAKYAALPLTNARHPDRHPEFLQPLYNLLVQHRRSQCKDPRDRIFALLGLVEDEERRYLTRIFPDYTLSEEDVLIIALAHLSFFSFGSKYEIGPESDDVFFGFGIDSKAQRKRLLELAEGFDYIGIDHIGVYMLYKQDMDVLEEAGLPDLDDHDDASTVTRSSWKNYFGRKARTFIGILAFSVGWTLWRYYGSPWSRYSVSKPS